MTAPRRPQDHKPKATATGLFSFTHDGKEYTFPKPFSAVSQPKFLRANRRRDELDMSFTMIEVLADDDEDILAAIDDMSLAEFNKLSTRMGRALRDSVGNPEELGESEAS
jgi:hypothetical protein